MKMIKTLKLRIKDKHAPALVAIAREVNQVWNYVNELSSKKLMKTTMAKSTHDAGWAMFKTMLEQKCHQAGIVFEVVNERYSTQACSQCGSIEGPKGLSGLGIRDWNCSCGAVHSRDVNAAKNILASGLASLAGGALA